MPGIISKLSSNNIQATNSCRRVIVPIIGIDRPSPVKAAPGEFHSYKLRTNPSKKDSPTFELQVPYFDHGSPEQWLKCRENILQVICGQDVTTYDNMLQVTRRILKGQALAAFNESTSAQQDKLDESCVEISKVEAANDALGRGQARAPVPSEYMPTVEIDLRAVTSHVFPDRAYQTQKRWMRRFMRKPRETATADFVARVKEINEYFLHYPMLRDGTLLPTKLEDDELLDILEFGSPPSWQAEFLLQGYDPTEGTISDFVKFCRTLETVEEHNKSSTEVRSTSKRGKKRGHSSNDDTGNDKASGTKHNKLKECMLHGTGNHDTNNCRTIRAQAERMKKTYAAQHPAKKAEYRRNQELNAIV